MLASLFNSTSIPVLEQVVGFTQARHNVLAGDIANLDTPGYHLRDLPPEDFQARLKEAIATRDALRTGNAMSQVSSGRDAAIAEVKETMKTVLYHDDSDFGLEQLVGEINKNQNDHNTAIAILRSQFALLQAAISERA